jgi:1-acyl-sn-glycerol-3-phosphate acyltransferase
MYNNSSMSSHTGAPPDPERLLNIVREFVRVSRPDYAGQLTLRSSFERDLALDSLARVELMLKAGESLGIDIPAQALSDVDCAADLLTLLAHIAGGAAAAERIELQGAGTGGFPEHAETLPEVLEWHVARQGERIHLVLHEPAQAERAITYRELHAAAQPIAAGLAARGLQPGQTVALMLPTGMDYLASFFGILLAGGIPVPIYPPARAAQIEEHLRRHRKILANAGAALLITVPQARTVAHMLQGATPELTSILTPEQLATALPAPAFRARAGDIAFLQYTSGSTGDPKGVALTHANLLANIRALGIVAQASSDDVFVSWLPLYHDMGLIGAWFGSLYYGIPLVLMSPLTFLSRPAAWLQAISRHHGTISAAPNFAYELCLRHISDEDLAGVNLASWRLALNGAEPVSPATIESFARRFRPWGLRREAITPVYGMAESAVGLAFPPPGRGPLVDTVDAEQLARYGLAAPAPRTGGGRREIVCCGRPLPGHEIRIVDESEFELPERRVGRLEFRGPSATAAYYRNPTATRALFRDGWLDSGDYAYMATGEVYITGRVKDLIKRGGRNLYPYDLEQAVGELAGVRRGCVAVFASRPPDAETERLVVVAETRLQDEAARDALRRGIQQAAADVLGAPADDVLLAPPHAVLKTSSGKIRRLACREAYEQGSLCDMPRFPRLRQARLIAGAVRGVARSHLRRAQAVTYGVYAWLLFTLMTAAFGGCIVLLRLPAAGRRIARTGARLLFRLAGVELSAAGLDMLPGRPHVLVVNHTSYLDAILLTALLPAAPGYAFVAKQEFAGRPGMGNMLQGLGTVFIERYDASRSEEGVARMAAALRRGESLLVFPEGTFQRQAGLQAFQTGAFAAASQAGVPVVVAAVGGARGALRSGTFLPARHPLQVRIGETLMPSGADWSAAVRLRNAARATLLPLTGEFDASP